MCLKKKVETTCAIRDILINTATNIPEENFLEYERKHLCHVTFKGMTVNFSLFRVLYAKTKATFSYSVEEYKKYVFINQEELFL